MFSPTTCPEEYRLTSDQSYWKRLFRASLERLRSVQLRNGSLYSNLRSFVPVLVLSGVWLWIIHVSAGSDPDAVLGRSITVRHLLLAIGIVGLWNLWLGFSVYDSRSAKRDLLAEFSRLATASTACGLLLLAGNFARARYSQGILLAAWTDFGLLAASAALLCAFFVGAILSPRLMRKRAAIIVGSGRRASVLRARLQSYYAPFQFYGCVDDEYVGSNSEADLYVGKLDELEGILKSHPIEVVLIGLPMKSKYAEIQRVIGICEAAGVESQYMRDIFETEHARLRAHAREPHHFTVWSTLNHDPKQALKRVIDMAGACLLLVLFSPLMLAAALAVRFSSPGPILFVQQRYGLQRRRFPMFKFRSMIVDAEQRQASLEHKNEALGPVFKIKADPRVTRIGALLRRTSIDELPQLFNVLRGDMSLVGPRPLPLRDVSRFEETWLLRRFSVRPGLTCLWQVSGRSNTSFEDWIKQDLTYIDQWSLAMDFKILLLTVPAVLRGGGAV